MFVVWVLGLGKYFVALGFCAVAGVETAVIIRGRDLHPIIHGNLAHPERAKVNADFSLSLVGSGQPIALTDVTLISPDLA